MNMIAIEEENGVSIMTIVSEVSSKQEIEAEIERSGFGGRKWVSVTAGDLPRDRSRRSDWRLIDGKVVIVDAK